MLTWIKLLTSKWLIGEGDGTPLQYSCLENPMDGGAWWAAVHGVAKNRTRLSDFTFTFHFHALDKEMATHSSVLAWRIPGTREPGGLPSMGSRRVRHYWSNLAAAAAGRWCTARWLSLLTCIAYFKVSKRISLKSSHLKKKTCNCGVMDVNDLLWSSFHSMYTCQIIMMYTWN